MPRSKTNEDEPAETAADTSAAEATGTAERPLSATSPKRELSRAELETLREKLRRKFH